jgi:hypothetical protein
MKLRISSAMSSFSQIGTSPGCRRLRLRESDLDRAVLEPSRDMKLAAKGFNVPAQRAQVDKYGTSFGDTHLGRRGSSPTR